MFVHPGSGNVLIYEDGALTAHGVTAIGGNHRAELANRRDQIPRLFLSFEPCLQPLPTQPRSPQGRSDGSLSAPRGMRALMTRRVVPRTRPITV